MSHNWGYKNAAKMSKDMGMSTKPEKVVVKSHVRAPRTVKLPEAKPVSVAKPQLAAVKLNCGGKVRGYAKGGAVKHDDAKADAAQIKGMVKSDCLKKGK